LANKLASLRQSQQVVVMCNGVFDLLHVGHVRVLQASKDLGDVLVVAINSDLSAQHHKGQVRPNQCAEHRAEILSALTCVDFVCVFEELEVTECLNVLQPNIHAKGQDYDPSMIPKAEQEMARQHGIELHLVGGEKANSSSDLIAKAVAKEELKR